MYSIGRIWYDRKTHWKDVTMQAKKFLLAGSMLASSVAFANHPSFDCGKVKRDSAEGIICQSDRLMDLDRELASLYKKAMTKTGDKHLLKAVQRGWIKGRNDCWKADDEKACMIDAYQSRIKELKEKYRLSGNARAAKPASATPGTKYDFDKTFTLEGITFHVQATNKGSENILIITPSGLSERNDVIKQKIDGMVTGAEIADLNNDGSPEIYIYVTSSGSGAYGTLVAYSANSKASLSEIYLPPLEQNKKASKGYMGHDDFAIVGHTLVRRFPVYRDNDPNCCPTGGKRKLEYNLVPGEVMWQLKLVKIRDLK